MVKIQPLISVLHGKAAAVVYHILFQIQPNDTHRIFLQYLKVMVHGKGKIGLAAAKVNDGCLLFLVQVWEDVLNELQETVNLAVFIVTAVHNPAFLCHDPQIHQERDRTAFLKDIGLLAVMGHKPGCGLYTGRLVPRSSTVRLLLYLDRDLSLPAHQNQPGPAARHDFRLPEASIQQFRDIGHSLLFGHVPVKCLSAHLLFCLEHQAAFYKQRTEPGPGNPFPVHRVAEKYPLQGFIQKQVQGLP